MHPKYPHVFSPIQARPGRDPHALLLRAARQRAERRHQAADDLVAYSAERVSGGGCGLVIVALVAHERGRTRQPSPHPPENIAAFRVMADAIHAAGGKIFGETLLLVGRLSASGSRSARRRRRSAPSVRQFGYSRPARSRRTR